MSAGARQHTARSAIHSRQEKTMNPQPYDRPQHPQGQDDRLLTIEEVADLTRLPIATLRFKRYDGSGPRSFRLGRRVRYWLSDVLDWIDRHYNNDGPRAA